MARVFPFRGVRYQTPGAVELAPLVAPPYDIIGSQQQEELYRRHPHNIVRLILGREFAGDTEDDNRYTRAAREYRAWRQEGILAQDPRPAVYVYEQIFSAAGGRHARRGVMVAAELSPFGEGNVYPHERTLPGPKMDRLKLTRATRAQLSPIFGLVPDESDCLRQLLSRLGQGAPQVDLVFADEVRERMWVQADIALIQELSRLMAGEKIFIADGHHRYETALNYRQERRQADGPGEWDRVLMMLVPMSDPGLVILPTHRLIHGVSAEDISRLAERAAAHFAVEAAADEALIALTRGGEGPVRFGLATPEARLLLTLRDPAVMDARAPRQSEAWRALDVSVLHLLLLEDLLGIDEGKLLRKENVEYLKDPLEALRAPGQGKYQAAFLLRPTGLEQLRAVALRGEVMPQKSTYFYPKLLSGLVIHDLGD